MLNIWQPWLAAERTNPQDVNSPFEQKFSFRLPVISCTHLHIVTLFLVFLFSFRRLKLNALKAWRQYLLLMKKEREREERRNQLRRRVAEILPDFQTWQKRDEMRRRQDQFCSVLSPVDKQVQGEGLPSAEGLMPKGAPYGHWCCKHHRCLDGSLSDSFTLHFMESFPSSLCRGVLAAGIETQITKT